MTVITTLQGLQDMQDNLSDSYELGADIDATASSTWNAGAGFIPVGKNSVAGSTFVGTFDGKGFRISNLYINSASTIDAVGLFGWVGAGATIKNVGLVSASVQISSTSDHGSYGIGALIGWIDASTAVVTVEECYMSGAVTDNGFTTGAYSHWTGGLLGGESASTATLIKNCYSRCSVTGSPTGGSGMRFGGFAGQIEDITISYCYATGSVSATPVAGTVIPYGFAQDGGGTRVVTGCLWDTQTSGQSGTASIGTGKTTAQMKAVATFLEVGYDFINIWGIHSNINNGYPYLHAVATEASGVILVAETDLVYWDAFGQERHLKGTPP